jgi:hypothetical protein
MVTKKEGDQEGDTKSASVWHCGDRMMKDEYSYIRGLLGIAYLKSHLDAPILLAQL